VKLDKIDVAILKMLQEDSRASFRDIAKKTGASVPTVSTRVERLEQTGILRGYRADIDVDKLNKKTLIVLIKVSPQAIEKVTEALGSIDEVRRLFTLRGSRLIAEVVFDSTNAMDEFLNKLATFTGIIEYDHYVTTRRVKEEPSAIIEESMIALLECFECHKQIEGDSIRKRIDGRDHYFCCPSCEKLFTEKYEKIKNRA